MLNISEITLSPCGRFASAKVPADLTPEELNAAAVFVARRLILSATIERVTLTSKGDHFARFEIYHAPALTTARKV